MYFALGRASALIIMLCLAFQALAVAAPARAEHGTPCDHALSNGCPMQHSGMACGAASSDCQGGSFCSISALVGVERAHLVFGTYPGFPELNRRCTDRVSVPDVPPPLPTPA